MNKVFNQELLIDFLGITLGILVLIILYRFLIRFLSRKVLKPQDYCTLYDVEYSNAKGEIAFYFTTSITRDVHLFPDLLFIRFPCGFLQNTGCFAILPAKSIGNFTWN
jgi:hypothetical protein